MKRRTISRDVVDVGILCPHCDHWTHSFYETTEVKRARAALNTVKAQVGVTPDKLKAAQAVFEATFKTEQQRVRGQVSSSGS